MGGAHSHEGLELSDSETEAEEEEKDEQEEKPQQEKRHPPSSAERSRGKTLAGTSFDEFDEKLKSLKIKYSNPSPASSQNPSVVKLYLHIGGKSPNARWIISEKRAHLLLLQTLPPRRLRRREPILALVLKDRIQGRGQLQLKSFPDQRRVDFVAYGVWDLKFSMSEGYREIPNHYQNCLFENTNGFEATDENKIRVFGNDFMAWARPEAADTPSVRTRRRASREAQGWERLPGRARTYWRSSRRRPVGEGYGALRLVLSRRASWSAIPRFRLSGILEMEFMGRVCR